LFLVLFGTVGCHEDLQAPEAIAEISAPDALLKLKADLRNESDAMAFHLRLNDRGLNSIELIFEFFENKFDKNSIEYQEFIFLTQKNNNSNMRKDENISSISILAKKRIDNYILKISNFNAINNYQKYLEAEFEQLLLLDLTEKSNIQVAKWLAIQIEGINFLKNNRNINLAMNFQNRGNIVNVIENNYLTFGSTVIGNSITFLDSCDDQYKKDVKRCDDTFLFELGLGSAGIMLSSSLSFGLLGAAYIAFHYWVYTNCLDDASSDYGVCKENIK